MNIMKLNLNYLGAVLPLLLITTLVACSANNSNVIGEAGETTQTPALSWTACEEAEASFECASLSVPMDYSAPDGEQIEIALIRSPATGTDRLGSLFVNFGGAVGRGFEDVQVIVGDRILPKSILSAYDIVGFDPRGVGGSTSVDCSDVGSLEVNPYPIDASEVAQLHADFAQFSTACVTKHGGYLQQIGSLNVVRDMERIRMALGDEKLNFLAYSFASRVAALYLQEYPAASGRLVLDGSVGPDSSQRIIASDALSLKQATLRSILAECETVDFNCDPDALIAELANRLNMLAVSDSESSNVEFEILFAILSEAVEFPDEAKMLSPLIVEYINTADISILQTIIIAIFGPDEDREEANEVEGEIEGDDGFTAETALLCADDAFRPDVDGLVAALVEFNQHSNIFAEDAISELARCAGWPESIVPLAPIVTSTAPASIIIGGTNDAIAPLALSEEMATAIGGVLIRSDHAGHISVFLGKSDCVDNVVETFLLDGTTPADRECRR